MSTQQFEIRFLPDHRRYFATGPITLDAAALAVGLPIDQPCGSEGTCGKCRVRVVQGARRWSPVDESNLSREELELGWRLACQLVIEDPCTIEIPVVSRAAPGKAFGEPVPPSALVRPVVDTADRSKVLGLAVDIGTTSLAVALIDLSDGRVVAFEGTLNPQATFGADVISRIKHSIEAETGLGDLTTAVRRGLADLVTLLLDRAQRHPDDVVIAAVAANPTMLHLWRGVSPAGLGQAPYVGAWTEAVEDEASAVGLPIRPDAVVRTFPMVRSHVGADATAGAIACRLDQPCSFPRLLIDLGTNTEILLTDGQFAVATSAAAGPAFEGVSINQGLRAVPGAIDMVSIGPEGDVVFSTVGGVPAIGICGSGLIDAVAELRRAGVIDQTGALVKTDDLGRLAPTMREKVRERLVEMNGVRAYVLATASEGSAGTPVAITARDIREVQLVRASIVAAVRLLCSRLSMADGDIGEVLIAGAFGNSLRKSSAIRLGLTPPIDTERIHFVGNAAGVGARLALVDRDVLARAARFAARTDYIELANCPEYQQTFMSSLTIPGH